MIESTFSPNRIPIRSALSEYAPSSPSLDTSTKYFSDIYKDLLSREFVDVSDSPKGGQVYSIQGISSFVFNQYSKLPKLISNRLFLVLSGKKYSQSLSQKDFCDGMGLLNYGSLEEKMTVVFKMIDFNQDGLITRDDCRAILAHVPVLQNEDASNPSEDVTEKFERQIKAQKEVEIMIKELFVKPGTLKKSLERLNLKQFLQLGRTKVSDLHLCLLLFLIETLKIPQKIMRFEKPDLFRSESPMPRVDRLSQRATFETPPGSPMSFSPASPAIDFTPGAQDLNKLVKPAYLHSFKPLQGRFSKIPPLVTHHGYRNSLSTFSRIVSSLQDQQTRRNSESDRSRLRVATLTVSNDLASRQVMADSESKEEVETKYTATTLNSDVHKLDLDYLQYGFEQGENSPIISPTHKHHFVPNMTQEGYSLNFAHKRRDSINSNYGSQSSRSSRSEIGSAAPSEEEREQAYHRGEMFRLMEAFKLKPYYYELRGQELYVYRKQGDAIHKDMYFLGGEVFIRREADIKAEKMQRTIYSFSILFPQKRREFFLLDHQECQTWLSKIKQAIGYSSLEEHYSVGDKIGNGKFGVVRQAIHRASGTPAAVKMIKKMKMNKEDKEATQTEIQILKLCQHPHVVRLYDIFENESTISLVQQLLEGGDFFNYLESKRFKLAEPMARSIAHQLATPIYYLHSYGVIHRDLKPENIMLAHKIDPNDFTTIPTVKIMDFGLSKIVGPGERANEPYGTLSYVAPEVLREKAYDYQVDLFSLGVVIYLMLSGTLPFDDKDDYVTAQKTMKMEPSWGKRFHGVSQEAIKFLKGLLQKRPEKRMTIEQVLQHPWLTKECPSLREKRRTTNDLTRFQSFTSVKY